jgi:hypothetical protein
MMATIFLFLAPHRADKARGGGGGGLGGLGGAAASAAETSISPVLSRPNRFRAARNWRSAF